MVRLPLLSIHGLHKKISNKRFNPTANERVVFLLRKIICRCFVRVSL